MYTILTDYQSYELTLTYVVLIFVLRDSVPVPHTSYEHLLLYSVDMYF